MSNIKIGITGATGQLGRKVIENLKQVIPAEQIVALVRNPEKAKDLGVEARPFDYTHPEQITAGLNGITKLLLISGNEVGQRFIQHKNIIEGAIKTNIPFIAYTSLLRADVSALGLAPEHKDTEELIKKSGLKYTILRNGWYTENYTGSISSVISSGKVYGSAGDGKISAATRDDYAKAAVSVLTTEGHDNKIYELGGEAFTLTAYAAEIAKQSGNPIEYIDLPADEFKNILEQAGFPTPMAQLFSSIDVEISKGALETNSKDLSTLIKGNTTPLSYAIKEALDKLKL